MTSPIDNFLNATKVVRSPDLEQFYFICESLDIYKSVFNDSTIHLIKSTDIYPEVISYLNKDYILFDVNYSRYIESLYNNIRFYLDLNNNDPVRDVLLNNIKSDAHHFLSLLNYSKSRQSLAHAKKCKELYKNPSLTRSSDNFDYDFHIATNLYLLRHEVAHTHFKQQKMTSVKLRLDVAIKNSLKSLKKGDLSNNSRLITDSDRFVEIMNDEVCSSLIESLLHNKDSDPLYEELFCDFCAFQDVIMAFYTIHCDDDGDLMDRLNSINEAINIFDMISDFYRAIQTENQDSRKQLKSRLRHSINCTLRPQILISVISAIFPLNFDMLKDLLSNNKSILIDEYQDVYLKELMRISSEIKTESSQYMNNENQDNESVINERNEILIW